MKNYLSLHFDKFHATLQEFDLSQSIPLGKGQIRKKSSIRTSEMHQEHHSNSRENHHLKPRGKLTPTFEVLNRKKIPYN